MKKTNRNMLGTRRTPLKCALLCLIVLSQLVLTLTERPIGNGPAHTPFASLLPSTARVVEAQVVRPFLLLRATDQSRLRQLAISSHATIYRPIKQFVNNQLAITPTTSAPFQPIPPANDLLDTYRNAGNQLIAIAFVCVVDGDTASCALAKRHLLAYANWRQWGEYGQRGLGHAHMVFGNALAYNWVRDRLSASEQQLVRTSLANWTHQLYEATKSTTYRPEWLNWWSRSYAQNHHWVMHSALGLAALALSGEDARATAWLEHAIAQMTRVRDLLNGINDGTWHEGIPYQNYALSMALPFWLGLQQNTGIDLMPHAYLKNYALWRTYNHIVVNGNKYQYIIASGNFNWDWTDGFQSQAILHLIAARQNDTVAQWLAQQLAPSFRTATIWAAPWNVFEFLYFDPNIIATSPNSLPKAYTFKDSEAVIWRTGWDQNALVFGLKSGVPGGRFAYDTFVRQSYPWDSPCPTTDCSLNTGHDRSDTNSFYLYKSGRWLAPATVQYDRNATSFSNAILIDGQGQYTPSESDNYKDPNIFANLDGRLIASESSPNYAYLLADATRRYKTIEGLLAVKRHILFVRPNYLIMLDQLAANTPRDFAWVSHFGRSAVFDGNWIRGDADQQYTLGIASFPSQPVRYDTGNDGLPFVHEHVMAPSNNVRFLHLLYPSEIAKWGQRPTANVTEDNGVALAMQVRSTNGDGGIGDLTDLLFTYGVDPYSISQQFTSTSVGRYRYDGSAAAITRDSQGSLRKLFVYGATYIKDRSTGLRLIEKLDPTQSIEVAYLGTRVEAYGKVQAGLLIYAPNTTALVINGQSRSFTQLGDFIRLD